MLRLVRAMNLFNDLIELATLKGRLVSTPSIAGSRLAIGLADAGPDDAGVVSSTVKPLWQPIIAGSIQSEDLLEQTKAPALYLSSLRAFGGVRIGTRSSNGMLQRVRWIFETFESVAIGIDEGHLVAASSRQHRVARQLNPQHSSSPWTRVDGSFREIAIWHALRYESGETCRHGADSADTWFA
ncbi:hypothetical protein BDBG_01797 [Blastomyces gilchristii SLH14081]|uniref:Uncharacterized protein n=1 Tax=Blastomyces gilchristii (strain SLH14081) TaxID=559298 RepID=A0A179UCC0_BLAGS|nr:uncharacterized protein BDBG_01797 [Blastomyces gilchristii SLH14081]OAT05393.1 hypothetical protein BDBG_01797 [Blastomyces gilchristii SLH14081]